MGNILFCFKKSQSFEQRERDLYEETGTSLQSPQVSIDKDILVGKSRGRLEDTYILSKKLGEGAFGAVYLGINKTTKEQRAIKRLKKPKDYDKYRVTEEIKKEINILKSMDHQNILKVYEYYEDENGIDIVTEMCEGGELFGKIVANKYFDEPTSATIMFQLLSAVAYCHSKNIMHRDLKTENILLEEKKIKGNFRIKLIDFGIAQIAEAGKFETSTIGTCYYMAPEVIKKNYDKKCDLWSCGVILYIMLSGKMPFNGDSNKEIFDSICKGEYTLNIAPFNTDVSDEAKDLIDKLLQVDPEKRISAEEALQHKWFDKWKIKDKLSELPEDTIKSLINNIQNYKPQKVLQQAALAYIVHNLPNITEVKEACKLFVKIDKNLDGSITKEEFINGINELMDEEHKFEEQTLINMFNIIDSDNSGKIEYEEFVRAAADKKVLTSEKYVQDAFKFFDKDGSGKITIDEMYDLFCKEKEVDKKELEDIIKEVDINTDGKVDFKEFSIMMSKIIE